MDALLKPDVGLMFWTVVNFLLLAWLLAKFAWKPLISALENREKKISSDIAAAQSAKEEAQRIQQDLKLELEKSAATAAKRIEEAVLIGQKQKDGILKEASEEAQNLIAKANAEISAQTQTALEEVKKELVNTTLLAVKKVISKEADAKTSASLVEELLRDIKK